MSIYDIALMGPRKSDEQIQRELKMREKVRRAHARRARLEKLRNDPEARGRNDHLKVSKEEKRKQSEENRRQKEKEYQKASTCVLAQALEKQIKNM